MFLFSLKAQDPLFYQFQNAPTYVSPTFNGTESDIRLTANYQDLHTNDLINFSYQAASIAIDKPFQLKNGDRIRAGFRIFYDQSGELKLESPQAALAGNYQKLISKNGTSKHFLIGAFDVTYAQKRIDFENFRFGSQHNGQGQFDPTLPTNEDLFIGTIHYLDYSLGLAWRSEFNDVSNLQLAFNIFHLNRPNQSFSTEGESRLDLLYQIVGIYNIDLTKKFHISPRAIYRSQGPSQSFILGTSLSLLVGCLLYTSPSPRDATLSRMPSSA